MINSLWMSCSQTCLAMARTAAWDCMSPFRNKQHGIKAGMSFCCFRLNVIIILTHWHVYEHYTLWKLQERTCTMSLISHISSTWTIYVHYSMIYSVSSMLAAEKRAAKTETINKKGKIFCWLSKSGPFPEEEL